MNPRTSHRSLLILICLTLALMNHRVDADQTDSTKVAQPETIADTLSHEPDSLRAALPDTIVKLPSPPSPTTFVLDALHLSEIDHQEFGDYVRLMPGFYPLDLAQFSSPARGLILGLPSQTMILNFRGRRIEDHLLGSPELGWVPPEALSRVNLTPLPLESPGARVDAFLRSQEPLPPASRIAVRDGYYGLGNVDFDLAQKLTPTTILNAGGRVTTYNGRVDNSVGYGLNLRSEIGFQASPNLNGWAGVMQNRLDTQVPYTSTSHNRERYDADIALRWKALTGDLYGYEQIETYGGPSNDFWQELGVNLGSQHQWGPVLGEVKANLAQGRWRLQRMNWSKTTFGSANTTLKWAVLPDLNATSYLGLDLSDDFAAARQLGLRLEKSLTSQFNLFAGAGQHQEFPSRFETSANFAPGTHFLPYDSSLYIYPGLSVQGNPGLRNETYSNLFIGTGATSERLSGALVFFWNRIDNSISWQVQDTSLQSFNGDRRENRGIMGWAILRPGLRLEFGATGSWLPLKNGDRRLFPEAIVHAWGQFSQPLFHNQLELRWRTWMDYWGKRSAPVPYGWDVLPDNVILSSRLSAYLLGVHLFWEVRNITNLYYSLLPGLLMMHKEEVWGVSWNFRN